MRERFTALLDLKALVMHSLYAGEDLNPVTDGDGTLCPTAPHALNNFIHRHLEEVIKVAGSPLNIIAVVDSGREYRTSILPTYKTREEVSPVEQGQRDLSMRLCIDLLKAIGVPVTYLEGEEADDVIAYLVENLPGDKVIYSSDRDFLPLVSDTTHLFLSNQPVTEFVDRGITVPNHLVTLYKSIVGDTADTYIGVKGLGPKAWESLIKEFGWDGMEQLSEWGDQRQVGKIRDAATMTDNPAYRKLAGNYLEWLNSYQIAKLHPEICTGAKRALKWVKRVPAMHTLNSVLDRGKLSRSDRRIVENLVKPFMYTSTLVTKENFDEFFKEFTNHLHHTPYVPWDYETTDYTQVPEYRDPATGGPDFVDSLHAEITGCSFAVGKNVNHVYYLSVDHKDTDNLDKTDVLKIIKLLEENDIEMVAHNTGFEGIVSKVQLGHDLKSWTDTMLYAHHVDENDLVDLKTLSKRYLNYTQTTYSMLMEQAQASRMADLTGEQTLDYGADDSLVTGHLLHYLEIITDLEGTTDFIQEAECPAVEALCDARIEGAAIDPKRSEELRADDAVTMDLQMATLRILLKEYCSQPNLDAANRLFQDLEPYVTGKAKLSCSDKGELDPNVVKDKMAAASSKQLLRLKESCFYQDWVETRALIPEFKPTPSQLTKVAESLGLPPIKKTSVKYLDAYLSDHNRTAVGKQVEFLDLLAPAERSFKTRDGDDYKNFAGFCTEVLEGLAPMVMSGTELNLGSPTQKQYLLYLLLDLPIRSRTKVDRESTRDRLNLKGAPSTNDSAIDRALAEDCEGENAWKREALEAVTKYIKASTRMGLYWKPYPLWVKGGKGFIHPGFRSCGAGTRRTTASKPNPLQISKGPVRTIFIPRAKDRCILSSDFSSQELVTMADRCGDPTFLSAYTGAERLDLHAISACSLAVKMLRRFPDVSESDLVLDGRKVDYPWFKAHQDDDEPLGKFLTTVRKYAKIANFGTIYSVGATTLSEQLKIPLSDAETVIDVLNSTYPGIEKWKQSVYREARITGYVKTTYGSRRHCAHMINSRDRGESSRMERQISNYLIQGQCADLLKVVLTRLAKTRVLKTYGANLISPVYDELVIDVPVKTLQEFIPALSEIMEITMPGFSLAMQASHSLGRNWGEQIEMGISPSPETINATLAKAGY